MRFNPNLCVSRNLVLLCYVLLYHQCWGITGRAAGRGGLSVKASCKLGKSTRGTLTLRPPAACSYNCGKVCLSLLGTWQGEKGEGWLPGISTANQVR